MPHNHTSCFLGTRDHNIIYHHHAMMIIKMTIIVARTHTADDSQITGPISLKSYTTIADFTDKKTKFSFKEGTTVQVLQKDSAGESNSYTNSIRSGIS